MIYSFFSHHRDVSMESNETFVRLIQVAKEDPEIREQLRSILSLDKFNRKSALHSFLEQMRLRQAPEEFLAAIACFLDDRVAENGLELLGK